MGCRWSRVQISPPRPFSGDLAALLLVQPFRQVDTHERGAGHKSASWSDLDATAWGMQLSTLNAYPSAVPVPKEIFADVLHALPLRSFNHHTRWKVCAAGVFQVFTTYRPHRPQVRSGCGPNGRATSRGLGVWECAR